MKNSKISSVTPFVATFFTLGPFGMFFFLTFVSAMAFVRTLPHFGYKGEETFVWFVLFGASCIGVLYLCGVWEPKRGNCITKKYASIHSTVQIFTAFVLYYFLLPIINPGENYIAYGCTWILITLQVWSLLVTLLFLRERIQLLGQVD
jgi:hypothetical protein